ncbi:MAG: TraR/DksA C4-type zinc finger protein [Actinomycetota bacterium]|nr:TraR/DksA C4-type zinc finger protein [Actinomycetota bacterium]
MTNKDVTKEYRKRLAALAAQQTGKAANFEVLPDGDHTWPAENPADVTLKGMAALRYRQILDAIQKLDSGVYGICADCGGAIDKERLEIIPEATSCVDCQRLNERKARADIDMREESSFDQLM